MCAKPARSLNPATSSPRASSHSWSLVTWLTVWYACSAFALILGATAFLYRILERNLGQEEDLFLADSIQDMRQLLRDQPDNMALLTEEVAENNGYIKVYMRLLTDSGQIVAQTSGMADMLAPQLFPPPTRVDEEPGKGTDIMSSHHQHFRALAVRTATKRADRRTHVIQVALSQAKKQDLLAKYRRRIWHVLGIALAACALISFQIARYGIRPVREISQAAQRVRSTTLDQRIPATNLPSELSILASVFNDMLARLQESFERLSQFSANIAHELRTPVNNLRGMVEVTLGGPRSPEDYRDTLGSCLEECVRLSRLIDSLLFLARTEQTRMPIQRESLNIGDELMTVRDFYEAAGTEAGIALTPSAPNRT